MARTERSQVSPCLRAGVACGAQRTASNPCSSQSCNNNVISDRSTRSEHTTHLLARPVDKHIPLMLPLLYLDHALPLTGPHQPRHLRISHDALKDPVEEPPDGGGQLGTYRDEPEGGFGGVTAEEGEEGFVCVRAGSAGCRRGKGGGVQRSAEVSAVKYSIASRAGVASR